MTERMKSDLVTLFAGQAAVAGVCAPVFNNQDILWYGGACWLIGFYLAFFR